MRGIQPNGVIVSVDYDLPFNKFSRALIYRLITLYEGEYYQQFMASDLEALMGKLGIEITGKLSVLLGGGRILKGKKKVEILE